MIMDTLAALALATEEPYPELLDDPPHGRNEPIISGPMYVNIVVATLYKLGWLLAFLYGLPELVDAYAVWKPTAYYQQACPSVLADQVGCWVRRALAMDLQHACVSHECQT
jgi:Ca2+-transporting ATPase